MRKIKLTFFELGSLVVILQAIGALLLALLGWFNAHLLLLLLFGLLATAFALIKKDKVELIPMEKKEALLLTALFLFGLLLSSFTTPTIFGGRDEGSFSSAAIMLSQDGKLEHSSALIGEFFGIYGPGKALNFPGFLYTEEGSLRSQFLPGYIAWTGTWHSALGSAGLKLANLFPFVIFLFSFFLILKNFVTKEKFAFVGAVLLSILFPLVVFFKFTLTEIFFASLLWLALHFFLRFLKNRTLENFVLTVIPLVLTPFVRIEALAIIFVFVLIFIALDFNNAKKAPFQLLVVLLGLAAATSILVSPHFFVDSFKNLFELATPATNASGSPANASFVPDDWQDFYLIKIFFNYNLLPLLVMGGIMIVLLFKKKTWKLLLPLFLFSPTLIYLIDANISLDHPWMLRRFLFTIIPLSLLYSLLLLEKIAIRYPRLITIIVATFFLTFGLQSAPFVFDSQNKSLTQQAEQLAEKFSSNDLVLISRLSSGSGWSLISEPLRNIHDKNAVYFFNPFDLSKINLQQFNSVFLLTSEKELALYEPLKKELATKYQITNTAFRPSRDPLSMPTIDDYTVDGYVFEIDKSQFQQ